jgi:hypothetical protein
MKKCLQQTTRPDKVSLLGARGIPSGHPMLGAQCNMGQCGPSSPDLTGTHSLTNSCLRCRQTHRSAHSYSLAPIGQVQPHDSIMRLQKGRIGSQIGWGP